jgi:hypothetical protein
VTPGALPEPIEATRSPFLPQSLIDLFLRPRRFFAGEIALGRTPYIVMVSWCYGMSDAIDRIDEQLMREQYGRPRPWWPWLEPWVTDGWLGYWAFLAFYGALAGSFLWLLGGWWYRVRLRWSGAVEPDARRARLAWAYSSFVLAAPMVLWAVVESVSYANCREAWNSEDLTSAVLLVFPFWSVATSHAAATTLFDVSRGRARVWFLLLPTLAYLLFYGAIGFAVARFVAPSA